MNEPYCIKRELQLTSVSAARLRDRRALFQENGFSVFILFRIEASGLSAISCSSVFS